MRTHLPALRRILDALYQGAAILAGVSLVAIAGLVTIQILARPLGLVILSTDELAGYALAASVFLALPHTLRMGRHVRVSLLIGLLGERPRRAVELWCLFVSGGIVGFFAVKSIELTIDFYRFNELSSGILAAPLWIPQTLMSAGLVVLSIAILDDFVRLLRGKNASYMDVPAPHTSL